MILILSNFYDIIMLMIFYTGMNFLNSNAESYLISTVILADRLEEKHDFLKIYTHK